MCVVVFFEASMDQRVHLVVTFQADKVEENFIDSCGAMNGVYAIPVKIVLIV
jgi:hypothetical protein